MNRWFNSISNRNLAVVLPSLLAAMARIGIRHGCWLQHFCHWNRWPVNALTRKGSHQQLAGTLSADGHFLSRDTAQYPIPMADKFAALILPLLTTTGISTNLSQVSQYFPMKSLEDPPFPRQDGGGTASQADWSAPHPYADCFQVLRKIFF